MNETIEAPIALIETVLDVTKERRITALVQEPSRMGYEIGSLK
ncbi:MAG: hypothetical protein SF066_03730 [Thermoanaerobaculia bacterium]|nr:hypothetical protein [Thermoanaerobaculia bacterium]